MVYILENITFHRAGDTDVVDQAMLTTVREKEGRWMVYIPEMNGIFAKAYAARVRTHRDTESINTTWTLVLVK
jgi:hypothetical protein